MSAVRETAPSHVCPREDCQRTFSYPQMLTPHERWHMEDSPWACDLCQLSHAKPSHLLHHFHTMQHSTELFRLQRKNGEDAGETADTILVPDTCMEIGVHEPPSAVSPSDDSGVRATSAPRKIGATRARRQNVQKNIKDARNFPGIAVSTYGAHCHRCQQTYQLQSTLKMHHAWHGATEEERASAYVCGCCQLLFCGREEARDHLARSGHREREKIMRMMKTRLSS